MTVRFATWNIHGFIGRGWRPDPERTLRVIARLGADILALQEVDGRSQFGRRPAAFELLHEALGGHAADARLLGAPGREYGHMLWSRWPIEAASVLPLPGPGREPRAAIDARIRTPDGPVRVFAAHFGLRARARRAQALHLAERVRPGETAVLMGDLNEWRANGAVHRCLDRMLPVSLCVATFPALRPMVALDRFYASAGTELRGVADPDEAVSASDHRPLAVDCDFPGR